MPDALQSKATTTPKASTANPEVVIGVLAGMDEIGAPLVDWPGNPRGAAMPALSTAAFTSADVGRSVALLFADGDSERPVIVGLIRKHLDDVVQATENLAAVSNSAEETPEPAQARDPEVAAALDGERVLLTADRDIELRCGKASITLTRAGKIIIRGEYVLSRSTGVNKIKGGSVQLN